MARLELALLGGFHATLDGTPITGFDGDKTRALLAYLAVEVAYPERREALAGLLWPEFSDEAARRNLRYTLFKLRQALGEEENAPGFLLITPQTVRLDPAADIRLDVAAFAGHLAASRADRHRTLAACTTCHAHLEQAAAFYHGEFLHSFYLAGCPALDEWLLLKREGLHRAAVAALDNLARYHAARAEYAPALEYTYRQLALEPWGEEAHRRAMRLLALRGDRSAALAQYAACRKALAEELNAEPSAETIVLAEQLQSATLPTDAGPPASHLPHPLTPLIGREAELRLLLNWLDSPDYPLLTIIGSGGVGKTRLAVQAAREQAGAFPDGVYWVPLAAVSTPDLLADSIAQALNLQLGAAEDPAAQLVRYLRDKELLLLLDNFEHLLPGGAAIELLLALLQSGPRLGLLVTSRERLGLQTERLLDLAGLSLPAEEHGEGWPARAPGVAGVGFTLGEVQTSSAVQLFVERARQASPAFTLSPETAPGVVEICRLVAGLPLGIVLAAAWVRHLPPARIAASIRANLDFLTSTARDVGPQHRSLRAVFQHSWTLLAATEQQVFRGLAVFRGGWDEAAAERVAGATLPALLSLVDKSLLRQDSAGRFEIHEVLRQYAVEQLQSVPGEQIQVQQAHARYYLDLAESAEAGLHSDTQDQWLARLEQEHDNLRVALRWTQEQAHVEWGLRLGAALSRFWFVRGYYGEGRAALAAALALPEGAGSAPQAGPGVARVRAARAKALQAAGDLARTQDDYGSAQVLYEESLALYRALGNQEHLAGALNRRAIAAWGLGDYAVARRLFEESLALSRELGNTQEVGKALGNVGLLAFVQGDYATARALLEETVTLTRGLGEAFNLAIRLNNLGNIAVMQGDYAAARARHAEALALRRTLGDQWGVAISLIGLGAAAIGEGRAGPGAQLLGAAEALLEAIGATLEADDRIAYEHAITAARAQLGEAPFARRRQEGRGLSLEQAVAAALEGR